MALPPNAPDVRSHSRLLKQRPNIGAAQLSLQADSLENREDALIILRLVTRLMNDFMAEPETTRKPPPVVDLIGGNDEPKR